MSMFIQALDAIRVSNSAMITADHLQVALVEEDFKKAWDLKTAKSSCIDRLLGIASKPELSGLLNSIPMFGSAFPIFYCVIILIDDQYFNQMSLNNNNKHVMKCITGFN